MDFFMDEYGIENVERIFLSWELETTGLTK